MAEVLAHLIGEYDERVASLDAGAGQAREDGSLKAAQRLEAQARQLRRELTDLHAMDHRLVHRFLDTRATR
jgi:hypothetical protein